MYAWSIISWVIWVGQERCVTLIYHLVKSFSRFPENKCKTFVNSVLIRFPIHVKTNHFLSLSLSPFFILGLFPSIKPQRQKRVFQGQEISETHAHELGAPMHDPLHQCPRSSTEFSSENMVTPSYTNQWTPVFTPFGVVDSVPFSRSMSVPNINSSESQELRAFKPRSETQGPFVPQNTLMLFGVNLDSSHSELPSPQVANYSGLLSPCSIPPISQSSVSETIQLSETSKSISCVLSEKQCKKCCSVSNRSCIKVISYKSSSFCVCKQHQRNIAANWITFIALTF